MVCAELETVGADGRDRILDAALVLVVVLSWTRLLR